MSPWLELLLMAMSLGAGMLFGGRQRHLWALAQNRDQLPTKPPPGQETWAERHQRLRERASLAARQGDLTRDRKRIHSETLQLQLSPHFMFNALSSVRWLWSAGEFARASQLFKQFVELWKHHWQHASHVQHSLNEELQSLRAYMDLEEVRLQRVVSRTEIVADDVDIQGQIPVLLLQPVIENALWHGFSEMPSAPKLEICIERLPREGDLPWVRMTVRDNGVGIREQGNHGASAPDNSHRSAGRSMTEKRVKDVHPEAWFEVRQAEHPWSTEAQFGLPLAMPNS